MSRGFQMVSERFLKVSGGSTCFQVSLRKIRGFREVSVHFGELQMGSGGVSDRYPGVLGVSTGFQVSFKDRGRFRGVSRCSRGFPGVLEVS